MDDLKAYRELRILYHKYRLINKEQAAAIEYAMDILLERKKKDGRKHERRNV